MCTHVAKSTKHDIHGNYRYLTERLARLFPTGRWEMHKPHTEKYHTQVNRQCTAGDNVRDNKLSLYYTMYTNFSYNTGLDILGLTHT